MANAHSKSFFGQTTGLIVSSSSKEDDFIFLKCVRKKGDGTWEKLSLGEGKTIKCSLDEMVMMLQVLERKISSWNTYHAYKDANTQINFNWKEEGGKEIVWIKIGGYSKMLAFPQIEILKMLLTHLLKEKIKYATSGKSYQDKSATSEGNNGAKARSDSQLVVGMARNSSSVPSDKTQQEKTFVGAIGGSGTKDQKRKVSGSIKGLTEKALLIRFPGGKEMWVPKSTVDPGYDPGQEQEQDFFVDEWILKKNKIET